jgi:hypothetical protein
MCCDIFSPTFAKKSAQSRYPFCHHKMAFSSHGKLTNEPGMGILVSARIPGALIETDEVKERVKQE